MPWKVLTSVEAVDIKSQLLSPPEACLVAEISTPRLLTWHSENLLPEPRDRTGRGFRRTYNVAQLAHLIAMRVLSDHGVPLSDHHHPLGETVHLVGLVRGMILTAFDYACEAPNIEAATSHPTSVVIAASGDGGYRFDVFNDGLQILPDSSNGPGIVAWMHDQGCSNAIIISSTDLGCGLRTTIEDIVERRGTPSLRTKIAAHQARFKRGAARKKPVRKSKSTRK
jgi:hypothetical protein